MAQQAVISVLERGGSMAVDEAKYLLGVSDKLEAAKNQLVHMQGFLNDLDDMMLTGGAMARNLVSEVREVAYEVEDITDTANILRRQSDPKKSISGAISKYVCFPIHFTRLHKLGARIDSANTRLKTIFENFQTLNIAATAIAKEPQVYIREDDAIQQWRSVHPNSGKQADVIGFDEQIKHIKDDLLDRENQHLTVVSIVGPGGAGKSTMAKKLYGLPEVRRHFDAHAWITVSQRVIVRHEFLKEIAKKVGTPRFMVPVNKIEDIEGMKEMEMIKWVAPWANDPEKMTEQELIKLLHEFVLSQSYLIVLDDIWSTQAWDIISLAFPDKKNGSRVILTTRNEFIAQHPNVKKKTYKPKLLDEEESTRLLLSTALPEYTWDGSSSGPALMRQKMDRLKELGKDLAVKCCGLPLAIVVLGGHLSRNVDVDEWARLTRSMDWQALITTDRIIGAILDLSYYDMPNHLRSCFMYTTAFPEDSPIDVRVLATLWVAEGFIPLVRAQTREEVAVKYVAELVQRCMVQVEERARSGRIKVIRLHDILRDWGIGRARREGFMKDCHAAEDIEVAYSDEMMKAYRVVLHSSLERGVTAAARMLRTLLCFENQRLQVDKSFQGLRVLYLNCSGEVSLPREIGRMIYLRYLGLGGNSLYYIPSSIGDLLSLETLYATAHIDNIPGSLWEIQTLRQVHVQHARSLSAPRISSQSKVLVMVTTTSGGYDVPSSDIRTDIKDAKRIVKATKLRVSKNKDPNLSCCLGMTYDRNGTEIVGRCKRGLQFPNDVIDFEEMRNTRMLKICCTNLLNNDQKILELGWIRDLKVLEIGEQSYTGLVMTCPSGSFRELERLVLHNLEMQEWKLESGSMTCLRELMLCKCPNLIYLPEELLRLPHIGKLDLIAMPQGCYEQGAVARVLENMGCMVSISSNEKDFQHLDLPVH